jgi:DNA-binding PucR family transcriptional regulator
VPRSLAVVAVDPRAALATPPVLGAEILAGLDRREPCLLVPDPELPAQEQAVAAAVQRFQAATEPGFRAAVGPAVPPPDAVRSLRWALRALALSRRGILAGEPLVWCRDHLATLAVFQDEELLAALVARRLAPLSQVREGQRQPLADTLLAWLQLDRNVADVAARLHVHPQTVRYRLRQLERLFGPALRDPELRFELEVALRALSCGYN